jgi:hypothetical protein
VRFRIGMQVLEPTGLVTQRTDFHSRTHSSAWFPPASSSSSLSFAILLFFRALWPFLSRELTAPLFPLLPLVNFTFLPAPLPFRFEAACLWCQGSMTSVSSLQSYTSSKIGIPSFSNKLSGCSPISRALPTYAQVWVMGDG